MKWSTYPVIAAMIEREWFRFLHANPDLFEPGRDDTPRFAVQAATVMFTLTNFKKGRRAKV